MVAFTEDVQYISQPRLVAIDGRDGTTRAIPFAGGTGFIGLAWAGAGYMLLSSDGQPVLTRLAADGTKLWSRTIGLPSDLFTLALASIPGRTLIVYAPWSA